MIRFVIADTLLITASDFLNGKLHLTKSLFRALKKIVLMCN